jgi:Rieske Fe-S protein
VSAGEIVLATHTPKGLFGVHAEMTVWREYAVAVPLSAPAVPEGIFWGFGDVPHSLRGVDAGGRRHLVVVGEAHKTGHHEAASTLQRLEAFARKRFAAGEPTYRWSAQSYRSPDHLPYVGKTLASRTAIATGFATDGLTYGTLAANLIADELLGEENPWHARYKATRFSPIKAARGVIEENVTVARAFVGDRLAPADQHAFRTIAPDTGAIVSVDGERFAAYRSPSGALALVSPVCTHMGCIVHWNGAEKSWDCPCHGSRFGIDGRVLEGPALAPLANLSDRGG